MKSILIVLIVFLSSSVLYGCDYVVGDVNGDSVYNGHDITYGVLYFMGVGDPPLYSCECTPGNTWYVSGDVNGSCSYNATDLTYGVNYFIGNVSYPNPCPDCPPTGDADLRGFRDKVMKIVDESGRRDNTMVIFTSEQGSSFPFGAKWTCYEMGLKTAFIVCWPAVIKAGTRNSALTQYVDVTPTLIEAAGGTPETNHTGQPDAHGATGFDGRSFLSVLLGRTNKHRDYVYGAHTTRGIINGSACYPVRSVRDERYKYIWNPNYETVFYNVIATNPEELLQTWKKIGQTNPAVAARARFYQHRPEVELYDLEKDPYELTNLADDPAYAEIEARLRKELDRWMAQQGDEGNATELKAIERQGPNRKWMPYDPDQPLKTKAKKTNNKSKSAGK